MKVFKFGGSSLANSTNIKKVKNIIINEINSNGKDLVVVLSAVFGITNLLFKICDNLKNNQSIDSEIKTFREKFLNIIEELLYESFKDTCKIFLEETINTITNLKNESNNLTKREERIIVAQGEIITSFIFHNFLLQEGVENLFVNALDFIKINEEREPDYEYINSVASNIFSSKSLYITQGYICRNHLGEIDNLGRGGSDYTASIIGYVLKAKEIQIWSDVSGIYNNDPRFVENTYPVNYLTFDEAAELAYFGAKVLHPSTVLPAQKSSIPVILKNTFNPFTAGTVITNLVLSEGFKAIAAKDNITIIQIKSYRMLMAYGFLRKIFETFERFKVPVDVITTSEVSVSLTIDDDTHLNEIVEELSTFANIEVIKNNTVIACVGYIPKNKPGYLQKVLTLLEKIPIRMLSYGSSDYNITLVIDTTYKKEALNKLNELFL
ncbi:MAG: aspartate kinase [Candidatus Calescibacterium sp.]|nr:aspartate kinase [Candidatus Calescibacterium sp.]MDW8133013.1 aspartate kinase [Candidatus Calescibacterium sp.]